MPSKPGCFAMRLFLHATLRVRRRHKSRGCAVCCLEQACAPEESVLVDAHAARARAVARPWPRRALLCSLRGHHLALRCNVLCLGRLPLLVVARRLLCAPVATFACALCVQACAKAEWREGRTSLVRMRWPSTRRCTRRLTVSRHATECVSMLSCAHCSTTSEGSAPAPVAVNAFTPATHQCWPAVGSELQQQVEMHR